MSGSTPDGDPGRAAAGTPADAGGVGGVSGAEVVGSGFGAAPGGAPHRVGGVSGADAPVDGAGFGVASGSEVVGSGFGAAPGGRPSGGGPSGGGAGGLAGSARRLLRDGRVQEVVAALLFLVVPARLFVGPVGPHRAPGLEGEGLYGQLFAGAVVRRWLDGEGAPGAVDVAGDAAWWPVAPLGALLQAVVPADGAFALGVVIAAAVWLAGYGPWRLARRALPGAPAWGAVLAGIAAQTSPVVLRALPGVDLAALAVGPIALGLAHPRLAWIGGLWSLPGAVTFGVAGLVGRRPAWLVAALPALALLVPASRLPAALRAAPPRTPTVPAYVTESGAAFPLPPEEQAPILATATVTRTGLWLPTEVSPLVRGNLFMGPPPGGGPPGGGPPGGGPPGGGPHAGDAGGAEQGVAGAPGAGGAPGAASGSMEGGAPGVVGSPGAEGGEAGAGGVPAEGGAAGAGGAPGAGGVPTEGGAPGATGSAASAPASDATASAPEEARPWIGAVLVPLQRVHGGPVALAGLLALLVLGGRGVRTRAAASRVAGGRAVGDTPDTFTLDTSDTSAGDTSDPARRDTSVRAVPLLIGGDGGRRPPARVLAAAGLLGLVGMTLVFGWQAAPGEVERDVRAAADLLVLLDADTVSGLPGGGALAWAAFVPALGALGIAALAGARGPLGARLAACVLLAGAGVPLENPRLVAPVASVPPDPVRQTLAALPADRLVVFPAPQWPYLQGQRPAASLLWEAAASGQRVEVEGGDAAAAGLLAALTARSGVPVDTAAARTLWEARADEPVRTARAAGWRYLLVDLDAVPPLGRPRLDGWLAERAGMPVARDGARLVYDLAEGPAGARPTPGGAPPEGALPPPEGALPPPEGALPPPGGAHQRPEGALPPPEGAHPPPEGASAPADGLRRAPPGVPRPG